MKKMKSDPIKSDNSEINTHEYIETLKHIKNQIQESKTKAILSANKELIKLYWSIGKTISERQKNNDWGSKVIENLAKDLEGAFPGIEGFSKINISRMKAFYLAYEIVSQAVTQLDDLPIFQIPWGQNIVILIKSKDTDERLWYAQKAIEYGWSRTILEMQIESNLYNREGKAITNFKQLLPSPLSDMAQQSFKDPYVFDFLTLQNQHLEQDLEQGLINHVQKTLLEMGKGFALVGRQYHMEFGEKDYYIDLLFYHFKLKCFIVVELKAREFDVRDTGQINFYLAMVDDFLRAPEDNRTIGLILCKSKNNIVAEYALRYTSSPIGIAEYKTEMIKELPKELKSSLPSIEEIEAELEKIELLENFKPKG